jgi:hypothetical protein
VDIEYVSKNGNDTDPFVNFSVKPQIYLPDGSASNLTFQQARPSFDLWESFHTFTILWTPTLVSFAIDGNWSSSTIATNVPTSPGSISISHWSDGNPKYSGGPPIIPATVTVSKVWAYYNSTANAGVASAGSCCKNEGPSGILFFSFSMSTHADSNIHSFSHSTKFSTIDDGLYMP